MLRQSAAFLHNDIKPAQPHVLYMCQLDHVLLFAHLSGRMNTLVGSSGTGPRHLLQISEVFFADASRQVHRQLKLGLDRLHTLVSEVQHKVSA